MSGPSSTGSKASIWPRSASVVLDLASGVPARADITISFGS